MGDSENTPIKDQNQQANGTDEGSDDTSDIALEGSKAKIEDIPEEYRDKFEDIRKGFQRSYTKKVQALSEKEKELSSKAKRADDWDKWYSEHKSIIDDVNTHGNEFSEYIKKKASGVSDEIDHFKEDDTGDITSKQLNKAIKLAQDANANTKSLEEKATAAIKMLMKVQSLSGSKYKDFNVDAERVMDYATNRRIIDMDEAIQGCYAKEIKEAEFAKRLEEEKEKWKAQSETNVLSMNMPMGKTVRKVLARDRGKR